MKKLFSIFILLFLFQHHCYSQKKGKEKIDSLFSVLSTAKEDTAKVNILNALSVEFRYTNTDTAIYLANEALGLSKKLNYEMGIADSKIRIGAQLFTQGKYDEAAKFASDASIIYNQLLASTPSPGKRNLLKKIYDSYNLAEQNITAQGNYPEGLKLAFLALKISEELGDKIQTSTTEFDIGIIYYDQHNYSEALKHYNISLKLNEQLGSKSGMSSCYNAMGLVYFEQGNNAEALKNYSVALKLAQEANDKFALAEVYIDLGVIYDNQANYSEALKYDFAALKLYEELGINFQNSFIYNNIATVYMKQKKYKDASDYLNKALSSSKMTGHLEYVKLSYQNRAALDSAQGNYKQALEHFKTYIVYRDSLLNVENTKKLVQQQMQYDFDKKESLTKAEQEKKDAIAQKELQKQKLVRNGFMGGFAVILLFAGVFFTQRNKIRKGKKRSDELLLNILPEEVAEELKAKGSAEAKQFDAVTVMFTDFKGFTQISEKLSPSELVAEIHSFFKTFDNIIGRHNIEKIKTIGDSYMCAGGLPVANTTNATDVVNAAMEIQQFMQEHSQQRKNEGKESFEIRIGIHTGAVVAGIVGVKKFAYDIWGDTVNIASRMESSGEAGKVNISGSTYGLVKDKFTCIHRGKIKAKNKGEIDMYFVEST